MADSEQPTHEPTQRRRQEARGRGQVVKSHDLASAVAFLGCVGGLYYFGEKAVHQIWQLTQASLANGLPIEANTDAVVGVWQRTIGELAWSIGPLLAIFCGIAIVANVGQTGWLFLPEKAGIDVGRVSFWSGIGRVFSMRSGAKLGFSTVKTIVIFAIVYAYLTNKLNMLFGLSSMSVGPIAMTVVTFCFELAWQLGVGLLVVAVLDYAFQYWKHEQDLRMTQQEMLEELKSIEPDPQVRSRRRQLRQQLAATAGNSRR